MRLISIILALTIGLPTLAMLRPHPTQFTLQGEDLVANEYKSVFRIKLALSGRGQAGLANFYTNGNRELLIKEDDPATCLLEGTAQFVAAAGVLPNALISSVNYASAGFISGADKITIVSIQDAVNAKKGGSVTAWDKIVYGIKRSPKTIYSFESWYPESIKNSIESLRPYAKWRLASAIMSSAIAGDESLHVGQFMAILDAQGAVEDIVRIDLGARERYAKARAESKDNSPFRASVHYSSSGQWGKDYVSFLLANEGLRRIYTKLWARLSSKEISLLKETLATESATSFATQARNLPQEVIKEALEGVLATINKNAKEKIELPNADLSKKLESLSHDISELDKHRFESMFSEAMNEFQNQQKHLKENIATHIKDKVFAKALNDNLQTAEKYYSKGLTISASTFKSALDMIRNRVSFLANNANTKPENSLFEQISVSSQIALSLLDAQYLSSQFKDSSAELLLMHFETVLNASEYARNTNSESKKKTAAQIIVRAIAGKAQLKAFLSNSKVSKTMGTAQRFISRIIGSMPNSATLMKVLRTRYNIQNTK